MSTNFLIRTSLQILLLGCPPNTMAVQSNPRLQVPIIIDAYWMTFIVFTIFYYQSVSMALAAAPSAPCAAYYPKEKKFSGRWIVRLCPKAAAKTQLGRF